MKEKLKKIRVLITDVDCVLTDCGMYYTKNGDHMKKFHTRDGMGVTLLKKIDVPTIIITKEKTLMVKKWAQKMKVNKTYDGIKQKELLLEEICRSFEIIPREIAYIGDDVNDIELLKKVGFSVSPKDGIPQVRKIVDYVSNLKGGDGVFREIADLIISAKKPDLKKFY